MTLSAQKHTMIITKTCIMWVYCKSTTNLKKSYLKLVNFMHVNYLLLGVESSSSQYLAYTYMHK